MLRAPPPAPVLRDELDSTLAKRAASRCREQLCLPLGCLCQEGVNTTVALLPVLCREPTCLGKRYVGIAPQPHIPAFATDLEAEHPRFGTSARYAKIKAAAIVQDSRPLGLGYLNGLELTNARHNLFPQLFPQLP